MQTRNRRVTWWTTMTAMTVLGAALLLGAPVQGSAQLERGPAAATMADLLLAGVGDLQALAEIAGAQDPSLAASATRRLRAAGPAGLAAFVTRHQAAITRGQGQDLSPKTVAETAPILAALDEICGQRDCAPAQLYWYTDLELAKAAARASGRPIVSLRLLGDLRDELSCANSRFFRALLYPDPAVSAALQGRFVLHWQSERPAPKITIELGDGRRIETTITGNSAHYVLDSAGRPVDVLPGLMEPQQFLTALLQAEAIARTVSGQDPATRAETLRRHHAARLLVLESAWSNTLAAIGQPPRPAPGLAANAAAQPPRPAAIAPTIAPTPPRAGQAAMLAISKSSAEIPMLRIMGERVERVERVEPLSDPALLEQLALRRAPEVVLSPASLGLIARQQWRSGAPQQDAANLAIAGSALRHSVALDGLYNEFALHHSVHLWFAEQAAASLDLEALNLKVYRELFLTPRGDAWLGLADPSVYSGLAAGGRSQEARI